MRRCLELALLGAGHTAPNPMVGAVLVHEGRIIGEGYHEIYGKAHAEVNCLASVKEEDWPLIPHATIYVSLEPCAHHGKTPPCADLIIEKRIPRVVVGCRDPFPEVDGKGIEKLLAAGVAVTVGVLEEECKAVNKRFFTYHIRHRPYILLKWAQSANGKMGAGVDGSRVLISNAYSNRLVHQWRSQEAAILVGTNTALADDPALTVRLWVGPNPIRLVIDRELRLPETLRLFDGTVRTIVFNTVKDQSGDNLLYYRLKGEGDSNDNGDINGNNDINDEGDLKERGGGLKSGSSLVAQLVKALYELKVLSVLVEGGALLLQSFIDEGYWDEARVITNNELEIPGGLAAPVLKNVGATAGKPGAMATQGPVTETLFSDTIRTYYHIYG